jgi:D-alanyl-D-alanine carboxypeptidase (penicillin-binding protein 5/6)
MEIASLTKIMTMIVCLKLCEKFEVDMSTTYFRASVGACSVRGTSAGLSGKEWVTVEDLMYGMMLPSGNDAALVLA